MEVNRDEALRCLDIARRQMNSGDFAKARKFAAKSTSLFPTPEAEAFVSKLDREEASPSSKPNVSSTSSSTNRGPGSSDASGSGTGTGKSSARPNSVPPPSRPASTDHKPVERDYTPEQVAAIKKIRSSGGDFYKVLGVSKDASDSDIKKAYRKLALQMHPDKNGAPGADEAFKIVSKAFTVLSDPQKRAIFDQHGPEDGKSSGVNYDRASPMGQGFGGGGGMHGFGEEISPEELFNMFFGGGGNFGGSFHSATFAGPGFGGRRQYTRTQNRQHRQHPQQQHAAAEGGTNGFSSLIQILPLILLFILSFGSNFFSDSDISSGRNSSPETTDFSLEPHGVYQSARFTNIHHVPYFVNEKKFKYTFMKAGTKPGEEVLDLGRVVNGVKIQQILVDLEKNVEDTYVRYKRSECANERERKKLAKSRAMGFFGPDKKMMEAAERMTTPSCDAVIDKFGVGYL
ncbi:hypothetical protein BGZ76_001517 [Entomortierella beljakovae]|nr:hypothetical protein BGZ76_001517 [Entomortierella beljakovae]